MSEAAEIIHRHSRSFSLAARFLPRRVRADVIALYAWCRTVDDVVDDDVLDDAVDRTDAPLRLERIKLDLLAIADGQPTEDAASAWIAPLIRSRKVEPRHAIELIEGMEMDLHGFRPKDEAGLRKYCYHAAGTVGLMMAQLMGTRQHAAKRHAVALGVAMQLTNIARDVREDAERGRSYLPAIDHPLQAPESDVQSAVRSILQVAEQQFAIASEGIHYLPRDCRIAVRIALHVYREIGREIERQDGPVMHRRVVISRSRLFQACAAGALDSIRFPSFNFKGFLPMSQIETQKELQIAQARSSVCFGLSLTAIMASVLFLLVFINPKEDNYGYLPLAYSGLSIVAAFILHQLSVRFGQVATSE